MINWKVRIKNKSFWIAFIPAILLLIQVIAKVFNVDLNFLDLNNKLIAVIDAIFSVLVILGVVNDPTTKGLKDSHLAMTYKSPKDN